MKADLHDWEAIESFYLNRQSAGFSTASWMLIRNNADRAAAIDPNWSAAMKHKDQNVCWELLFQTFYKYKKIVLQEHQKFVNQQAHPEFATNTWKAIYAEYMGDEAVE